MKLGPIVLRLRLANTRFESRIAGAAELETAMRATLKKDMAFVIPLTDDAAPNTMEGAIDQTLTERFGVIGAFSATPIQSDKTGLTAYDQVHGVRDELFRALLGLQLSYAKTPIVYRGGKIITFDRAYLWYQFEFECDVMLRSCFESMEDTFNQAGIQPYKETDEVEVVTALEMSKIDSFDALYTQYIMHPSLKWLDAEGKEIPLDSDEVDMEQYLDLTEDQRDGAFSRWDFATAFDTYKK